MFRTILRNFRRLWRATFLEPRLEVDPDDVPGFLRRQREKAVFSTMLFFLVVSLYNTFGRPGMPVFASAANGLTLIILIVGFGFILHDRLRAGVLISMYGALAVLGILQAMALAVGTAFRPLIINVAFFSVLSIYALVTSALFLDRRHVVVSGVLGVLFITVSLFFVGTRDFANLAIPLLSYVICITVLVTVFSGIFERILGRLMGLTANLRHEVEMRTRELSESEKRYRLLFDNASLGIFRTTPQGRVEYANEALARLFGYASSREVVERVERVADYYARPAEREMMVRRAAETEGQVVAEIEFRRLDGSTFLADFRFRAVRGPGGRLEGFEGFIDDITAKRRAEEENRRAKERAEQESFAKSIFLANMSHELRTPLNSIMGFSELLLRRGGDAQTQRHAQLIHNAGADLLGLINDLLDISRIEAGTIEVRREAVDIRRLVSSVGRAFADEIMVRGLSYRERLPEDLPSHVEFDGKRLRQVLTNLVGNAVKFTSKGSIAVEVECRAGGGSDEIDLTVRVADTGRGIAPEDRERIFELFYQARRDGKTGAGLGLAIARQLTGLMGGSIAVTSRLDEGSTFTVTFPGVRVLDAAPSSRPDAAVSGAPRLTGRCLLVDDVEENRIYLKELLSGTGLELFEAFTGEEALQVLPEVRPDVILLDLRLPGIDGYEVLRRLRATAGERKPPVVAVTASVLPEDERRVEEAGFDGLLKKPFGYHELMARLLRVLGQDSPVALTGDDELAREWRLLPPDARVAVERALRAAADSGGVRQMAALGRLLEESGKTSGLVSVEKTGDELAEKAEVYDVAGLRRVMANLEEVIGHG